ncbi:unnamed protein product [Leptosia nina]|uniref:Hypoxia-inducible factor 1-alpha n=1 Tax=Leptosia nina TaxID=320188 RepID=A0AAV1JVX6_9NEOP
MLVAGEPLPHYPVPGAYDEVAWAQQGPMQCQWTPISNACDFNACNVIGDFSTQCYNNYVREPRVQYYCPPIPNVPCVQQCYPNKQFLQALPCRQTQQWDYNSMCYNVDGEPCQFTNVVDLEDFMNSEKRKEKSRVAARCRRTKEMQIFAELTAALPAKKEEVEQLDKASVMRLAISYLRVRDVVSMLPADTDTKAMESPKGLEEVQSELSYMKALDGFVLVLSQQGDIVYCSENIAEHLGVSQMEIMGQSVFEFSHPCDHDEIREALRASNVGRRDLLLRLKCTITSKGRNVHLKSASYKVIHLTGHMLTEEKAAENNNDEENSEVKKSNKDGALVAVGRPIPHPSNIEIPLDSKTFLTKHSLDMKFTYTDDGLMDTLGFEAGDLNGRSLYDYHHAADSASLAHQFKSLFSKGQCETGQYRFLAKSGGYAWVQTQATVITDKQQKPVSVVCVNYVISGIECKDEVFAAHQVQHTDLKPVEAPTPARIASAPANGAIVAAIIPKEERPIPVTELIFAPREEEMNKGYLTFSQIEGHTMLKDEPEDLTHLAPTAGDACIPLENSPFDMFDEFILNDNYTSLLGDDLTSGSPVDSLIADSLLSSPERQENESTGEQSSLLTELSLDAYDSARSDNDIDDGNSPFIPTTDDLPVLEPAVMWGALPDSVRQARPQPSETQTSAPALQRLLAAPPTGPPPQDLITNIYSDQGLIPSRSISSWDTGVKRVLTQEEEPRAKRAKRSPSPAPTVPTTQSSSSVLMNLLEIQQAQATQHKLPNYRLILNPQLPQSPLRNIPIPVINIIQAPNKQMRANTPCDPMSPLSLNVNQIYSLPSSPNYSPAISPVQKDNSLSSFSTPQSLSPASNYQMYSPGNRLVSPTGILQGYDPYLSVKMQPSPGFPMQCNDLLDSKLTLASTDFWPEADVIQGTSELLTAFDDVKGFDFAVLYQFFASMASTPKQVNGNASPSNGPLGKRKKSKGKSSYLSKWLDKHHIPETNPVDGYDLRPNLSVPICSQFSPCYEPNRYMFGSNEPTSLPSFPTYYSPIMHHCPEYRMHDNKSIQVQRPRLRRRKNKAEELSSTPADVANQNYMQPKNFSDSQDFASLPPIVTSTGDTNSNSDQLNDKDDGSNARRYSDPCMRGLPDVADHRPTNGEVDSEYESSSDLSGSQVGSRLLSYLLDQISSLKVVNERLNKELLDTRVELERLQHQDPFYPKGAANIGAGGGQYSPGYLTELVREIRDATRIREEAMYARLRSLVLERNDSGSASTSSETKIAERNFEEIKASLRASEADKRCMMDRINKLEDELRLLRVSNCVEPDNRMVNGNAEEADCDRLRMRRELTDMRKAKQTAEDYAHKLERLVTQLRSKSNGMQLNGPDSLSSEHDEMRPRRTSANSTFMCGPVTDL